MAIGVGEWECPFCRKAQMAGEATVDKDYVHFSIGVTKYGHVGLETRAMRCVNPVCNEPTIDCRLSVSKKNLNGVWLATSDTIFRWPLRPASSSKPQPDYIPEVLRNDYYEACLIRELSPKASATLARRCLQGMIRDFCKISKPRLIDEIKALEDAVANDTAPRGVQPETIDAIHAIRKVGNIGAHMERDIDLIVDVDPGEAQALLELIEMLFDEWYVASERRRERLARVATIAAEKAELIAKLKSESAEPLALTAGETG